MLLRRHVFKLSASAYIVYQTLFLLSLVPGYEARSTPYHSIDVGVVNV